MVRVISNVRTQHKNVMEPFNDAWRDGNFLCVEPLVCHQEQEVLRFLETDPIGNAIMCGRIRDYGLESYLHRGSFYGCRDQKGHLKGVALIGHVTLFEARNRASLIAFARAAQSISVIYSIAGEYRRVDEFWRHFTDGEDQPHRRTYELMLERRLPAVIPDCPAELRLATTDDLDLVVEAHARLTEEELGIKPLESDPSGFRARCRHRILQKRVWVWIENNRLLFKADVISDSPEVTYLEGVYVDIEQRGKGIGSRCLSCLSHILLSRKSPGGAISVLVNEQHYHAQAFYAKMGFKLHSRYQRITLQK